MIKNMPNKFSEITPEIEELAKKCEKKIDPTLFEKIELLLSLPIASTHPTGENK